MRHEEEHHWHPDDPRHPKNRRERSHSQDNQNFNDFKSRWGEPDPRFISRSRDWQQEEAFFRDERRGPEADWRPFEHRRDEQNRRSQEEHPHREPVWRQHDRHFNSSNQHADDRWSNDSNMPHPEHHRHHEHEHEHRRQHHRGYGRK